MKRKIVFLFLLLGVVALGKLGLSLINSSRSSNTSPFPSIVIIDDGDDGTAGCLGIGNEPTSQK